MDDEANTFHRYDGTQLPERTSHEVHHLCVSSMLSKRPLTTLNSCHAILQTSSGSKTEIQANYLAARECLLSLYSRIGNLGNVVRFFSRGKKIVFTSKGPPSLLFGGYRQFFLKHTVAQAEADADHSRTYKAEVKNEWSYVSTLPYTFVPCRQKLFSVHRAVSLLLRSCSPQ